MDRRGFLRKFISPRAPEGKVYPLEVQSIPHLSKALGKEPEEIRYVDANDVTTHQYTYYLQRKQGEQTAGTLVLSLQLSDNKSGGEVTIRDMKPSQPQRQESLLEATHFSLGDNRIAFYEGHARLLIRHDYEVVMSY